MNLSQTIAALQAHYEEHGETSVYIDVHGQFYKVTHTDVMVMRDAEGDTPVTFINFDGKN